MDVLMVARIRLGKAKNEARAEWPAAYQTWESRLHSPRPHACASPRPKRGRVVPFESRSRESKSRPWNGSYGPSLPGNDRLRASPSDKQEPPSHRRRAPLFEAGLEGPPTIHPPLANPSFMVTAVDGLRSLLNRLLPIAWAPANCALCLLHMHLLSASL